MSLLLDALKKAADDKQKALQLESANSDVINKAPSVTNQLSDDINALVNNNASAETEELSLQDVDETQEAAETQLERAGDGTAALIPDDDCNNSDLKANDSNTETVKTEPLSMEHNENSSGSDTGGPTLSDEALTMLIYKTNRDVKQGRRILVSGVLIVSLAILVSSGAFYYMDLQEEISALERKHQIAMQAMRSKTNREKTPSKSEIIRNLVSDVELEEKVRKTKPKLPVEKSTSQTGLALPQKTEIKAQNKSSGTSSGAGMHRLRTKGRNYHASPEGVSAIENTNNKTQAYKANSVVLSIQKTKKSDPVGEKLDEAWLAYESAHYAEATILYKTVLSREEKNRDALLGLGAIAVIEKNIAVAKNTYLTLLELDPRDPIATAALASLHGNKSSLDSDKKYLLSVLQKNPNAHHLNFALGNIYAQQNNWKSAQQYYFKAWQNNNENADYVFNLAVSMDQLSKQQQAIKFYKECLLKSINKQVSFSRETVEKRISELSEI